MGTKMQAISEAWSDGGIHKIRFGENLGAIVKGSEGWKPPSESSENEGYDAVILELLALNDYEKFDENMSHLEAFAGTILVYGSDSELLRYRGRHREALAQRVDGWIANCEWQAAYWRDFELAVLGVVREPVDCEKFRPGEDRESLIVSGGNVSYEKRSDFFIDLFETLLVSDTNSYRTGYIGNASLWGLARPQNLILEGKLRNAVDKFYGLVPASSVSSILGSASIIVLNPHYETCNRLGMEALASGTTVVAGPHLCYDEWGSSVHRFDGSVKGCMKVLEDITQGFSEFPDRSVSQSARQYAVDNFSYKASLAQLEDIFRRVL